MQQARQNSMGKGFQNLRIAIRVNPANHERQNPCDEFRCGAAWLDAGVLDQMSGAGIRLVAAKIGAWNFGFLWSLVLDGWKFLVRIILEPLLHLRFPPSPILPVIFLEE
jgi:hypothetical protein